MKRSANRERQRVYFVNFFIGLEHNKTRVRRVLTAHKHDEISSQNQLVIGEVVDVLILCARLLPLLCAKS